MIEARPLSQLEGTSVPARGIALGWTLFATVAIAGALALWFVFADAVFVERVLAALANCF